MRKTLLWIVTATLLLSSCGSSTEHAAVSAQPQEEITKAVEETAEASTETEAEDDLTSKFLPKDEADEILEKAEVTKNELVTLVSSSPLAEDDRYHTIHLVNYVYDIYSFTIPFTWLGFDDNDEIWIETDQDHGATVLISSTDSSEYGIVLTEENVSAGGNLQAADHVEGGALSAAGRPQKANQLSIRDLEAEVAYGNHILLDFPVPVRIAFRQVLKYDFHGRIPPCVSSMINRLHAAFFMVLY